MANLFFLFCMSVVFVCGSVFVQSVGQSDLGVAFGSLAVGVSMCVALVAHVRRRRRAGHTSLGFWRALGQTDPGLAVTLVLLGLTLLAAVALYVS